MNFKVVFLGDANVGKTSIVQRYVNRTFSENPRSTLGVDFHTIRVSKTCTLSVWDTAGTEAFHSVTRQLLRGIHVVVFVFDVSSTESFINLTEWVKLFNQSKTIDNPVMYLVANKTDKPDRRVSFERARSWAEDHNMSLVETSCRNAMGIQILFKCMMQDVLLDTELGQLALQPVQPIRPTSTCPSCV